MEIIWEKYLLSHSYLQVWKSLLSVRYLQVKNLDAYKYCNKKIIYLSVYSTFCQLTVCFASFNYRVLSKSIVFVFKH